MKRLLPVFVLLWTAVVLTAGSMVSQHLTGPSSADEPVYGYREEVTSREPDNEQLLAAALEQANATIEEMNSQVADAQTALGGSRAELEETIESLEEHSTVPDPR